MKILVGVKRVIDYSVNIRVKPDMTGVVTQGVKMSMNPFDDIAVEEAVRLKEKKQADEVISVTIGTKESQSVLRTSLAKGVDRSIHILTKDDQLEPLAIAKLLNYVIKKENPSLVFLGKQAIDDDSCQTSQILAGMLKWQQATFASKFDLKDGKEDADVTREIDGGLETINVKLPAVVSCDLRLNTPRYANLPAIAKARKKKIDEINVEETGVDIEKRMKTLKVTEPSKREGGKMVQSVDELIEKLRNEAKVI